MIADKKLMDDLARVASSAVSIAAGLRQQVKTDIRDRIDSCAHKLDLVSRDEFELVKAMLIETRAEQARLKDKLDALEQTTTKPAEKKASEPVKSEVKPELKLAGKANGKTKKAKS